MNSSQNSTIEFVERTLRWIALAEEPLSVAQIAHAISVEVEERSFDDSLDMGIILGLCRSLVRESSGKLVFSHFSVKEYLMKISPEGQVARFRISNSDHSLLAQTCLTYLLLDDFDRQGCMTPADLMPVGGKHNIHAWTGNPYPRYPFYNYAAFQWIYHTKACNTNDSVWIIAQDLFNPVKTDQFLFWAHLQLVEMANYPFSMEMYEITPLHLACIFGFVDLVDMLLCNGANGNATDAMLGSPLQCAIAKWDHCRYWTVSNENRYETVRRLLREPISRDQSRYDPLSYALECGDEEMASILLKHGFTLTRSVVARLDSEVGREFLSKIDVKDLDAEGELSLRKKIWKSQFSTIFSIRPRWRTSNRASTIAPRTGLHGGH